jgi:excisionase family DNA binding protein
MNTTSEPATFDTGQLAELLQCSERHVQNLVIRRVLPSPIRLGALVRWDRETIRRWLAGGGNTVIRGNQEAQARG